MKYFLTLMIFAVGFTVQAQLTLESGTYTLHSTVRQHGTKEEIYKRAMVWVDNSLEGNIKYENSEKGQIEVEATMEFILHGTPNTVRYTLLIEARSGMYRETFQEFEYKDQDGKMIALENKRLSGKKRIIEGIDSEILIISKSLIEYISSDVVATR